MGWRPRQPLNCWLLPALGSRWIPVATGDWPGWLAVKVARRPEQRLKKEDRVNLYHNITKVDWAISRRLNGMGAKDIVREPRQTGGPLLLPV